MNILGSSELVEDVQKKDLCIDCGACVGLCPYFVSYNGKIARLFPCTLPQGRCYAHCPKTQVDLNELSTRLFGKPFDMSPLGHFKDLWKAKAGPRMDGKGPFQNGGTVSALVAMGFREGHFKAAALTDRKGLTPLPVLATNEKEALACSGSKYMASPTLSTVTRETVNPSSSLAVVGTACQMTALAKIRMNPLMRDDFRDPVAFSIGLFCTWALDTRRFKALIPGDLDPEAIVSMDVPPPPSEVMVLRTDRNRVEIPLSEVRTAIPTGCTICPDMTAEFSDVSVGALEGDPGWNTLIVRSDKGAAMVAEAVEKGYLITEAMQEGNIAGLEKAAMGKKRKSLSNSMEKNLLNLDCDKGRSALIIDKGLVDKVFS
jgi:coenzyme F420 hydrogenase subunit beta